jgi:pimeloyl-ACP methyl ester carboxylesterase
MTSHADGREIHRAAISRSHLVLAAGLLCDETVWAPVADILAPYARSITVISFPDLDRIESMAEKLLAEAPSRFALAGHSMGGRVALEVFRRAPARVERLALLNTGIHPTRPHEAESRGALVQRGYASGMADVATAWLPPMLAGATDAMTIRRLQTMVSHQTAASFAAQTRALLNRPPAAPVLAQVDVPTLLIAADEDAWSPVAQHEEMLRLQPDARLEVIRGAGHMAPVEAPSAVAAALLTWLGGGR